MNDIKININSSINIHFLPTSRHKNERQMLEDISLPATIKNLEEKDFPVAFRVTDSYSQAKGVLSWTHWQGLTEEERKKLETYEYHTDDIRFYNGECFKAKHINIYGSLNSDIIESNPETIKSEWEHHNRHYLYDDSKDLFDKEKSIIDEKQREKELNALKEKIKDFTDRYVMFNGQLWERCGEPHYNISYFGLSNEPAAFIQYTRDYSQQTLENFEKGWINRSDFSALHYDQWNQKYKDDWKYLNNEKEHAKDLKDKIEVLLPEAVKFKDVIDFAEIKKQNMRIEEIAKENLSESDNLTASTPKEAADIFIGLTKGVLSVQPKKNIYNAVNMVLASFSAENKNLLDQFFLESGISSKEKYDQFFEKTFGFTHRKIEKTEPTIAKKKTEIQKPSPEKIRHITSREHDIGFSR